MVASIHDLWDVTNRGDADVIIERDGKEQVQCRAKDRSPQGRAAALRFLCPLCAPGDRLILGGLWHHGMVPWRLPAEITLAGLGQELTMMVSNQEAQAVDCGFEIMGRNLHLEDMTLVWEPKDNVIRGGQTLGMAADKKRSSTLTTGKRLRVIGKGMCALYYWGDAKGHVGQYEECDFYAGRWAGCIGAGSGDDSALLKFLNCRWFVDFATYGGAGGDMGTPPNNTGFVCRGGRCSMKGGSINVIGYQGNKQPRSYPGAGLAGDLNNDPFVWAIGATTGSLGDRNLPNYKFPWPYLTLEDVEFNIDAPLASRRLDLWQQFGTIECINGRGSGPNGTYLADGNVNFLGTARRAA